MTMVKATDAAARKFFATPAFAVVGASSNPAKFGHKVYAWYLHHKLDVTPINPGSSHVTVGTEEYPTLPNLSALPNPEKTAVSIITHPAVTLGVLEEAKKVGVRSLWMQPGTFDEAVLEVALADGAFDSVVYGDGGRGTEGWCVLVDGERALKDAGRL
ncbi:hypothetical protein DCS_00369 [Drechmeria coniospora]|uniref:CoA-binding domain-containing protein n=1 Tax=Drechmeria coniospora TaxID=98403 RepID=A0A151GQ58_DRECN|nr:hypothetical protein DCS_00369 [Drechmeria coniospora]KYK59239.1 hypothetical protein DCS_00369 [Drechmeria coniospora]ODA77981.1 hypothetical protein RJ55_06584 [Drechmeria coniospora]